MEGQWSVRAAVPPELGRPDGNVEAFSVIVKCQRLARATVAPVLQAGCGAAPISPPRYSGQFGLTRRNSGPSTLIS